MMAATHALDRWRIQELWDQGLCPIINGILFGNDQNEKGDFFTSLHENQRHKVFAHNLVVVGGETSAGSEGFVALLTLDTEQVLWIALFANSNPFIDVRFDASRTLVVGITSHNHVWEFPCKRPEAVQVTYGAGK
jgi:hypothetical protein